MRFVEETYDAPYYQKHAVINYPSPKISYIRAVEHKYITGQQNEVTVVTREYPSTQGEPFYPIPNSRNNNLYRQYSREAAKLKSVYFIGRLSNYKYFNMDQAIKNALDLFNMVKYGTSSN